MQEIDLPHLPENVHCYNPTTMESMLIVEAGQQSFPVPLDIPDKRVKV